ncbi:MAG: cupin domain-containing protein [Desulfobacterales bacterium]|nr:cupin domain-containing protein [Desulfobacterales bacterium]
MPRSKKITTVGERIKAVRLEKKITLDCMANETGFSIDYLKNIESGKTIPPVGALLQIAKALEMNSGFFLKEQDANLEKRVKAYTTRTESYAYMPLTAGAENKHLKAFRITIDPMTAHKGVGYLHEGEEFVYVLKGKVEVTVGDNVNSLSKDESLHFNSGIKHHLQNIGNDIAELVVIVYSP